MPNHCDADLRVTGPAEQVSEFLAKYVTEADGIVLNLSAIRPYPPELEAMDKAGHEWDERQRDSGLSYHEFTVQYGPRPLDGFNQGGYEWCIENWGTKWGCYQTYGCDKPLVKLKKGVVLHFSTAWSPFRFDLLQIVSAKLPDLLFQYDYFERGIGFQGRVVVQGGSIISQIERDYHGSRGG